LYSLNDFSVGRLGTAPELYTVRPYGLKGSFILKQLVTQMLIRCSVQMLTPYEKQTAPGVDMYLVTNKLITALVKIQ